MEKIKVSDKEANCPYIAYAAEAVANMNRRSVEISFSDERVQLAVEAPREEVERTKAILSDCIAEIVCIGYKYNFFSERIHPAGLDREGHDLLISSIIAADFEEEFRYARMRLKEIDVYTIDGFFDFRMQALRDKWKGVAACVPEFFSQSQLVDFVQYLFSNSKKKIFLKNGKVYDWRCRRLHRSALIGGDMDTAIREIILSGAGKIECLSALSPEQEKFLRRYYADRVEFSY